MEFQVNCINFLGSCITNRLLIERPQTLNLTCFYPAGGDATTLPENAIRAHPDFRMIVLANRPGFPFLGNDFFGSLGKSFFCQIEVLISYFTDFYQPHLLHVFPAFGGGSAEQSRFQIFK